MDWAAGLFYYSITFVRMKITTVVLVLASLFLSCGGRKEAGLGRGVEEEERFLDSDYSGTCPYLSAGKDGAVVLSWVRQRPDGSAVVVYSVAENGADFGEVTVVPGSSRVKAHGENPPKVVVTPGGKVLAAWGVANPGPKNAYSGLVYYSVSLDNGLSWTHPALLSNDPESIDQRYFDLELLPDGNIGVVWLDNRSGTDKEGSGLYFARLGIDNSFEAGKRLDNTVCQCCRTDLFAGKDGALHVAYRKIIDGEVRDMVHIVSTDNGDHFTGPGRISADNWKINGCPHTGPAIAWNDNGLFFVWYTMGTGNGIFFSSSPDNGRTFSSKNYVSDNASAKHPQIHSFDNGSLAAVWDEKAEGWNRVALEIRSPGGEKITADKQYLTDERSDASYPVLITIGDKLLVAYSIQKDGVRKDRIAFRVLEKITEI